jgi:hypothetical protein
MKETRRGTPRFDIKWRAWAWEHEASAQHEHFFYMHMSGIPLSVIRKGLGPTWSPPPGTGNCG